MKTILLTGARAPVTLDLARALHKKGHRVLGAESMPYPLSIHSTAFDRFFLISAPNQNLETFKNDLLKIVREEKVDLIIPTCEEAFHLSRIRAELEAHCRVLVDDFQKLGQLHSKFEFSTLIHSLGMPGPRSFSANSVSEALKALDQITGEKVVLKPEYSRFASKTLILERGEARRRIPELSVASGTSWVIQECLEGPEFCTYSVAIHGELAAQVTYEHEFTAGRGAGICFEAVDHRACEEWVKAFVKRTNFHGQIAFDFIETKKGLVLPLECNPRATSGLHLISQNPVYLENILASSATTSLSIARPKPGSLAQLRLAMLVYGLPSVRSFTRALLWLKIFIRARETVFSFKDLMPFLDQFVSFFTLIRQARKSRVTPLEVSTRDIEWNGSEQTP